MESLLYLLTVYLDHALDSLLVGGGYYLLRFCRNMALKGIGAVALMVYLIALSGMLFGGSFAENVPGLISAGISLALAQLIGSLWLRRKRSRP